MTEDMPRKLPLYVSREKTRHGKWVFYFRIGKGERIRLPDYGTPEFQAEYKAALTGTRRPAAKPTVDTKSLKWLVERYMESAKWAGLSVATRKQQGLFFKAATDKSGAADYRAHCRSSTTRWLRIWASSRFAARSAASLASSASFASALAMSSAASLLSSAADFFEMSFFAMLASPLRLTGHKHGAQGESTNAKRRPAAEATGQRLSPRCYLRGPSFSRTIS